MKLIVKIGIGFSIMLAFFACRDDSDLSDTPELFFRDFQRVGDTMVIWSLGFTDGNGDIGVRNDEDPANFFPIGFKIVNGIEEPFPSQLSLIPNRIPVVQNVSTRNGIEGEFKFTMLLKPYRGFGLDTIYLSTHVEDRANNKSNSIRTPLFSVN